MNIVNELLDAPIKLLIDSAEATGNPVYATFKRHGKLYKVTVEESS